MQRSLQTIANSGSLLERPRSTTYAMPTTPLYAHRLSEGIEALSAMSCDWVDRRTVEEALGVSKWTAWRILKRSGAQDGPGGCLVCRRDALIRQLQAFQQDGRFSTEIARHNRVEQYLDGIVRYASRKHKEIARNQDAVDLLSSRFLNLPPGVELEPGELRIQFFGTEDFLQKFSAVVYALHNDYEQISEFIEAGKTVGARPAAGS
jgi:hypothetical protein